MTKEKPVVLFWEDFSAFTPGAFPFDREHSAMGEYHYWPPAGFTGRWYDPITNSNFRGPSWFISQQPSGRRMEQMRVRNSLTRNVCSVLVAGDDRWQNYTVSLSMQSLNTSDRSGLLFRYHTSLMHYAFFLCDGQAEFWRVEKSQRTLLKAVSFAFHCDEEYRLAVSCCGSAFTFSIDGQEIMRAADDRYASGKIALAGFMPAMYGNVVVSCSPKEYEGFLETQRQDEVRLAQKRARYFQPLLYKVIDLKNFGASRQIRFGHLTGDPELYFVIAQHQKRVFKERYCNISCLTAVSLSTGEVLWQIGEPSEDPAFHHATCDLPFQVYDINGDGVDEVVVARNFRLYILDGRTGQELHSIPTPLNTEPADSIPGIEFKTHAFDRLNVDAIRIVNVGGNTRPSDILIKDRYARLWVYNCDLELLWQFSQGNTGHFPVAFDFNGDGRDEVFSCYNMISSEGKLLWSLPIDTDHTDEIVVGPIGPKEEPLIAIVSGWEGFMLVDFEGNILMRDINGHGQRISVANYCPARKGYEICTTTYWENQGIVYLYDAHGNEIWHMEPSTNGNIIAPVNWQGDGSELILLNGNVALGGMLDGDGDRVVIFPDDGHPEMCAEVLNVTGDARDEIILWDSEKMFIYTQDRPIEEREQEYVPEKYAMYNASNYRGEYAFAHWIVRGDKRL